MKKLLCAILAAITCAALAGCKESGDRPTNTANGNSIENVIKQAIGDANNSGASKSDGSKAVPETDGAKNTDEEYTPETDDKAAPVTNEEEAPETGKEGSKDASVTESADLPEYDKIDVDLTSLSSTMVYSEVYNMITEPDKYLGKTVKMNGAFAFAEGNGRYYFACIIADAAACCSQGIEFLLADGREYPSGYPETGTNITVTGIFDTYYEGTNRYCQLIDAVMS